MQELTIPKSLHPPTMHVCVSIKGKGHCQEEGRTKKRSNLSSEKALRLPDIRSNEETRSLALPVARSLNFELAQSPRWWSHHVLMNLTGDGWIKPRDTRDRRGFFWYFFLELFGTIYLVSISVYIHTRLQPLGHSFHYTLGKTMPGSKKNLRKI